MEVRLTDAPQVRASLGRITALDEVDLLVNSLKRSAMGIGPTMLLTDAPVQGFNI